MQAEPQLKNGAVIDKYSIIKFIGRGHATEVYEAILVEDLKSKSLSPRLYALKMYSKQILDSDPQKKKFYNQSV